MSEYRDKTLLDNNRRLLNLQRPEIENALPEYFSEDFPNLIELFKAYYEWLNSENNPGDQIQKRERKRDATQVQNQKWKEEQDELVLGQDYFGGCQVYNSYAADERTSVGPGVRGKHKNTQHNMNI